MSPSALIPFCGYGGNMSSMGQKIDHFNAPVCNSFKAKVLNDRLCYEVDIHKILSKDIIKKGLKAGLILLLDYNEDRQVEVQMEKEFKNASKNPLDDLGNF